MPALPATPLRRLTEPQASELREAVERFLTLTECARRACEERDVASLHRALDARELVAARLETLGRTDPVSAGSEAQDTSVDMLQQAVAYAVHANDSLVGALASRRDEIRRELERVTHDEVGIAGYAQSMPRGRRLDLRR